ncbi:hypothetical protein KO481_27220 [Nocardia sp. NEAU-G5]|uniref:Glycosyltransferase family 1 protein n=1 Tax=Nocardia albiluteola TaxID=2842303 RepID=A0ABS6B611_9NOCA|nr:hypothetical protein [Nocardia albiluteola]MBU3065205.1 hypothetical protein [Nocardia albiluteola]
MQFNVTLADPRLVTPAFDDVLIAVTAGLRDLGHTTVNAGGHSPDRVDVVFGYHLAAQRFPGRCVAYQLEPVCDATIRQGQVPVELLRPNVVWDYSRRNVEQLLRHGIQAHYVPFGFHPRLQRVAPAPEQDIDVLFYGSLTARRLAIISALRRAGLRVAPVSGSYGEQLDPVIARAKVVLNLHSYREYRVLESVRVGYLLSNRKAVVAEVNAGDDHDDLAAGIAAVRYPELVDACVELVRDDAARTALEAAGFAVITGRPMTAVLDAVLHTAAALDPLAGAWGPRI